MVYSKAPRILLDPMVRPPDTTVTKSALRELVLGRRDAMRDTARSTASRVIVREVIALAAYRESSVVLGYAGFGSELQTDSFLRHVLEDGKMLVLPKVDRVKKTLDLYEVEDPDLDLEPGTWGIPEPKAGECRAAEIKAVEFVLVPGVAFDARGGRLGYGAGFYDKLLTGSEVRPHLVAGAFDTQIVETVPRDHHDVPMDLVITESRSHSLVSGKC